jgi:hypothetical protein
MSTFNQGIPGVPTLINSSQVLLTGNAASANALTVRQFGTGNVFSAQTTSGTTALFVGANGNVGVGTASPNQTLEIGCNNATGQHPLRLSNYNTGLNATKYIGMEFRGTDSMGTLKDCGQIRVNPLNQDWGTGASMSFLVRSGDTVSTERMTILGTSGNVGIGTTSPSRFMESIMVNSLHT